MDFSNGNLKMLIGLYSGRRRKPSPFCDLGTGETAEAAPSGQLVWPPGQAGASLLWI